MQAWGWALDLVAVYSTFACFHLVRGETPLLWAQSGKWPGRACLKGHWDQLSLGRWSPPRNLRNPESCRRSPFHPTRTASAVTHGHCLLVPWCAARHRHLLAGAGRSVLAPTLRTPSLHCHLALLLAGHSTPPFLHFPGAHHPPWPGSGPKSGVAHSPNLGKELKHWGLRRGWGTHRNQGGAAVSRDGHWEEARSLGGRTP